MIYIVIILGLIIGSFLNSFIWRLYAGESFSGRSFCPQCRAKIHWYDNVPVASFLLLKGRCRYCKKKISWQYPLVEIATALLFVLSYLQLQNNIFDLNYLLLARNWLAIAVMIIVFVYDFRWQIVSLLVVVPTIIMFIVFNIFLSFLWWQILIAGLILSFFFFAQYIITKKKGIGEGDIWLGALAGVLLVKLDSLFIMVFLTYVIGSIVALTLLLFGKKKWGEKLPLGVFISIATILTMLYGTTISEWYFNLF
ncbi:prepilin peptidase [Patescibacteria group bacterium]|nr:prepilin peptidase [Patescibacteria group bacterium]